MNSRVPPLGPASRRHFAHRPSNVVPLSVQRFPSSNSHPESPDPFHRDADTAQVEAALWLADEPLTSRRIAEIIGLTNGHEARRIIDHLRQLYDADASPFQIEDVAGGYQLLTRPVYQSWLLRLRRTGYESRLTPTALETLAVIAYKQPITRADVEAIRGVSCAEMIRILMEKGLIRISGRHDSLGRPQLYSTSKKFLQAFGLNSLQELPAVESLPAPNVQSSQLNG